MKHICSRGHVVNFWSLRQDLKDIQYSILCKEQMIIKLLDDIYVNLNKFSNR